jgi:hypothetical protein
MCDQKAADNGCVMRLPFRLLALLVALTAGAAPAAAQAFEGIVTMKLAAGATSATVYAKGSRARYEMNAGGQEMVMLVDTTGALTMLIPGQKKYMVMRGIADQARQESAKGALEFKKTGKQASYAGYKCDVYLMSRGGGEQTQMCITGELGSLGADLSSASGSGVMSADDLKRLRAQFGTNFFILWMAGADGKVLYEVTKVEKTAVPEERLALPAGYTEMKGPGE